MGTILKKKNMFTSINYNDSSQRVTLIYSTSTWWSSFRRKNQKDDGVTDDKARNETKEINDENKRNEINETKEESTTTQKDEVKHNNISVALDENKKESESALKLEPETKVWKSITGRFGRK